MQPLSAPSTQMLPIATAENAPIPSTTRIDVNYNVDKEK
jgi:hypothetical protein